MAHFNLENIINDAIKMDAPMQRGPLMRWQRKALESGVKSLSLDASLNTSLGPRSGNLSAKGPVTPLCAITPNIHERLFMGKTPNKTPGGRLSHLPRSPARTPNRGLTPKHGLKTPRSKSCPNTPHQGVQDRFIPSRSCTDLEQAHFLLTRTTSENILPSENPAEPPPAHQVAYQEQITLTLNDSKAPGESKILSFQNKPKVAEAHQNNLKVLYSGNTRSTTKVACARQIPKAPDSVMDIPDFLDDYYLNLLDWSCLGHVAVGLGSDVYLWDSGSSSITELPAHLAPGEVVTSVAWVKEGNILAVGNSAGSVQLFDVGQQKLVRTMAGHASRVPALSWNSYVLSSGSRTGAIHQHDVRVAEHHLATLSSHIQEVCGLRWSPDGRHLASGANDNVVNIWEQGASTNTPPVHTFTHHQAAVKALAWCPWQSSLLATGGGTADRTIRFWNVNTGSCLNTINTNSQVSSLLWSQDHRELISGHGYSQNQLSLWKYPSLQHITDLTHHTGRILSLALSHDGSTVASVAADESLCLWRCFAMDKAKKKTETKPSQQSSSSMLMRGSIR